MQIDRRDAEVGAAELALDRIRRHALTSHLDRVGVAGLVRGETASDARGQGETPQLRGVLRVARSGNADRGLAAATRRQKSRLAGLVFASSLAVAGGAGREILHGRRCRTTARSSAAQTMRSLRVRRHHRRR